jgi:V8-like Glu-specific endopeptidase
MNRQNTPMLNPAFFAEWESESEAPPVLSHPRLGAVWSEPRQELEGLDLEAPAPIMHPRLGYVVSVPRGSDAEVLEEIEPEIILGDQRQPVRDTKRIPYRWICFLRLNFGADPRDPSRDLIASGSGTLISSRHVLTAGHTLFDDFRPDLNIVRGVQSITVVPARNGLLGNQALFGSSRAAGWRFPAGWQARFDLQSDFGLISLKDRIGDQRQSALGGRPLGFWGSPRLGGGSRIQPINPAAALRGREAEVSGYPGDKCRDQPPVGGMSAAQAAACPANARSSVQWNSVGRITNPSPAGAPRLLLYDMDTVGGHSGSPVWLRQNLNLVGIHTGPGRFVPGEPPAVSNRGIRITDALVREIQSWRTQPPVTPAPSRPMLRAGSRGVAVFELQTRLNLWLLDTPGTGVPLLVVDGIFGPKTRQAVITFQRALRLKVDGIVGPQTWGALQSVLRPLP